MRRKVNEDKRKKGQRKHKCNTTKCQEYGRALAYFSGEPLAYCPRHRKKGERVINFLLNSLMRYKLTNLLQDAKHSIFIKGTPQLCKTCSDNFSLFINRKIEELDELEKTMPLDEIDMNAPEEFEDSKD